MILVKCIAIIVQAVKITSAMSACLNAVGLLFLKMCWWIVVKFASIGFQVIWTGVKCDLVRVFGQCSNLLVMFASFVCKLVSNAHKKVCTCYILLMHNRLVNMNTFLVLQVRTINSCNVQMAPTIQLSESAGAREG